MLKLNSIFTITTLILSLNLPVFAKNEYKVNIQKNLDIQNEVIQSAKIVDDDFQTDLTNNTNLEIRALQLKFTDYPNIELNNDLKDKITKIQKKLLKKLQKEIISYSFATKIENKVALHEITVGLLNVPFNDFQKRFNPAKDWGKYLYKYAGGEVLTDLYDENHKEVLQRERMLLGAPWYAVGVPLLDMSKYEIIEYENNKVSVKWKVSFSENNSVFLDIGYVKFQKYQNKTIVIFNSIHIIDQGWFGNALPEFIKTPIALQTLSDMFKGHIENYKLFFTNQ